MDELKLEKMRAMIEDMKQPSPEREPTALDTTGTEQVSARAVDHSAKTDPSKATVMVVDGGVFTSFAESLVPQFDRVMYSNLHWKNGLPSSKTRMIGDGIPGVERVDDFFEHVKDVDLFIFTDTHDGDLQEYLRSQGKLVFGCGIGEKLELCRAETKQIMKKLGLAVNPYKVIRGIDALRAYLEDPANEDKYIKISITRGDTETFRCKKFFMTEARLDRLAWQLGPYKHKKEFIVEDSIKSTVEGGYDGWNVDGEFPSVCGTGYEIKDAGYAYASMPYDSISKQVIEVNGKLSPVLKAIKYRGPLHTEIRVNDKPYLIDFTGRFGSPPFEIMMELYSNLGEVFMAAAQGEIVVPVETAKYGVEVAIMCERADENWQAIDFPKANTRWVKLRNFMVHEGHRHVIPQSYQLTEIGMVVGLGDTLIDAIKSVTDHALKVEGDGIVVSLDPIAKAVKEIADAKNEYDMPFGIKPLPTLEEVAKVTGG